MNQSRVLREMHRKYSSKMWMVRIATKQLRIVAEVQRVWEEMERWCSFNLIRSQVVMTPKLAPFWKAKETCFKRPWKRRANPIHRLSDLAIVFNFSLIRKNNHPNSKTRRWSRQALIAITTSSFKLKEIIWKRNRSVILERCQVMLLESIIRGRWWICSNRHRHLFKQMIVFLIRKSRPRAFKERGFKLFKM